MSIFPMIDPASSQNTTQTDLPLCMEVAWDFERGVPIFRSGEPLVVTGKEAVKVWVYKAMTTPRYRYCIYTWAYGSDFETLRGKPYTDRLKEAEAPRYLRECLLINPYITAVSDIDVSFGDNTLTISATVATIYGEVQVNADL